MLAGLDIAQFLQRYWQQQPLLLRAAIDPRRLPLTPAELAGLACEPDIEARLISGDNASGFHLQHGPFAETTFTTLPDRDWTVLVQAVDHCVPAAAALLDEFRFIPNWRIDDVMVSYAAPGGSAGPHYDNYDVFLVQGRGRRRWQIGATVRNPPLQAHPDLRLLQTFTPTREWQLEAGDILYLPPGIPHWGVSTSDDCMTYSVGFRAPSAAELLSEFCDRAIATLPDDERYRDSDLHAETNPGAITPAALERVRQLVLAPLSDPHQLARWFGQYMTQPKYGDADDGAIPDSDPVAAASLQDKLRAGLSLHRDPASRFAYCSLGDATGLFVNGAAYTLSGPQRARFAAWLCGATELAPAALLEWLADPELAALVLALHTRCSLYFEDEF